MADEPQYTIDANIEIPGDGRSEGKYSLGSPAADVYQILQGTNRYQVIEMGRRMAQLTIPSVLPPLNYRTGDYLPGNNQSVNARAVNNLASKMMFMAFPPGQPMMRLVPDETKMQAQINQDPQMYAQVQLALSRVEEAHREKAATIQLATAWVGHCKLLLVGGNSLWKHVKLSSPTFHPPTQYVVSRDMKGHPLTTIHEEMIRLQTLPKDVQDLLLGEVEGLADVEEWTREAKIFSVCKFIRDTEGADDDYEAGHWEFWEETEKGTCIPGTEVETDYDAPAMWPSWCVPVYGQNWGRSYCEEYRGDLYILENDHSSLNDGAALAALALLFVKPGGRTSLRQVQQAKNLTMLSGSAEDMTTFRSDKTADFNFVLEHAKEAEKRIGYAFLVNSATVRQGERVTAEEVERTGQDLDQAMGGLYTELAQGSQRKMVSRFVRLHEESNKDIPALPADLVKIQVVTGVDAMGRSRDVQALDQFAAGVNKAFPPNSETSTILDPEDFSTRYASSLGIKPEGLVKDQQQVQQDQQQKQAQAQSADMASKAIGPAVGPMAQAAAARMMPPPGAQQGGPQQAPPPPQRLGA